MLSGIIYGLSLLTKQTIWFSIPFYFIYMWHKTTDKKIFLVNIASVLATVSVIVAPFFLWDPKAYLDSTIFYLSGSGSNAYPISGYGWSMVLSGFGFITNLHEKYPFYIWQLGFGIPVLYLF